MRHVNDQLQFVLIHNITISFRVQESLIRFIMADESLFFDYDELQQQQQIKPKSLNVKLNIKLAFLARQSVWGKLFAELDKTLLRNTEKRPISIVQYWETWHLILKQKTKPPKHLLSILLTRAAFAYSVQRQLCPYHRAADNLWITIIPRSSLQISPMNAAQEHYQHGLKTYVGLEQGLKNQKPFKLQTRQIIPTYNVKNPNNNSQIYPVLPSKKRMPILKYLDRIFPPL